MTRFLLLSFATLAIAQEVRYSLHASGSTVRVTIETADQAPRVFVMPRAIPMGYGEQRYERYVAGIGGVRQDGPRWRFDKPVRRVEYTVDIAGMERDILSAADTSKSRDRYLGLLGYSVFGFFEGQEDRPVRLRVEGPSDWPVFSTLAPRSPPAHGSMETAADNYYALADSQIAMGPALQVFVADSKPPLYVASYNEGSRDPRVILRLARESLDALTGYFGSTPFPHFSVHLELLKPMSPQHEYGFAMEHMTSATIFLGHETDLDRQRFHVAHHIAHAWIPKRCAGPGYFPFQWELAPVLDTIWFSEGFGQYAAMAAIRDTLPEAGRAAYMERMLERFRSALREAPAFIRRLTAVELSRAASTRYSEDFRTGRNVFSRCGMMAYEMDQRISEATGRRRDLRHVLRELMTRRAFRPEEFGALVRTTTGVDIRDIMDRWLGPMPQ